MSVDLTIPENRTCIEQDVQVGERLIALADLGHEPWMPRSPRGMPMSYKSVHRWVSQGLEVTGKYPTTTTKSAVLRFFKAQREAGRLQES